MTADPGETPAATGAGTVDLTADAKVEAADIPPALVAQSLGQYMRAWLLQIRSGNSGVLPVVLGIVIVAVVFEIADRIAVLYLGRMVAEGPTADFDRQIVVEYMTTGSSSGRPFEPAGSASGEG